VRRLLAVLAAVSVFLGLSTATSAAPHPGVSVYSQAVPPDDEQEFVSVDPVAVPSCTEPCIQVVIPCHVELNHTVGNPAGPGYTVRVIGSASCDAPIVSMDIRVRMETPTRSQPRHDLQSRGFEDIFRDATGGRFEDILT
jgi:hypothetical protein